MFEEPEKSRLIGNIFYFFNQYSYVFILAVDCQPFESYDSILVYEDSEVRCLAVD